MKRESKKSTNDADKWQEWVREGLTHYHDTTHLGRMYMGATGTPFTQICLDSSNTTQRGYAVQAALRWGMEELRVSGSSYARHSAETLWLRFVDQQTVKACAVSLGRDITTIKQRQRKGWERLASVLEAEWRDPTAAAARQRSIYQAQYAACEAGAQRLLRFLAIFQRFVSLRVALTAEGIGFQFLAHLLEQGLVVQNETLQIRVRDGLRDWVLQQLNSAEILTFYKIAAQYRLQQGDSLSAINHWQRAGQHETAANYLLENLDSISGDMHELLAQFERQRVSADIWARLNLLIGQRAEQSENLDVAFAAYETALCADDHLILATAHYRTGRLQRHRDIDAALAQYSLCRQFIDRCSDVDSIRLSIMTLLGEAWVYTDQRPDLSRAQRCLDNALYLLDSYTGEDVALLQCDLANARAAHCTQAGDLTTALASRWQAWRYARQARDVERAMKCAHNLAWDNLELAHYEDAERMFLECQLLAQEMGNEMIGAACNKGLGGCSVLSKRDYPRAIRYYEQAYSYFHSVDSALWMVLTGYDLAEAHLLNGSVGLAMDYFSKGAALADEAKISHLQTAFADLQVRYLEFSAEFTPDQRLIFNTIRTQGRIDKRTCAALLNISGRTANRRLDKLLAQKRIKALGSGRSIYYVLHDALT
ncbi:MAG: hypothetical protein ACPG8W_19385 [Candidatus Promineifilaceae bacterium]